MPRIDFDAERREQRSTTEPLELVIAGRVLQLNPGGIHPDVLIETERLNDLLAEQTSESPSSEDIRETAHKMVEMLRRIDHVMILMLAPGQEEEWAAVRAATGEDQVTVNDLVSLIGRVLVEVSGRPLESAGSPPSHIETPSSTTASTDNSDSPAGAAFPIRAVSGAAST